jgi:hypothetical protein
MRGQRPGDLRLDEPSASTTTAATWPSNSNILPGHGSAASTPDQGRKIHPSSALKVVPTSDARRLAAFADDIYFHQVIERCGWFAPASPGPRRRPRTGFTLRGSALTWWRIHFHIPLHSQPTKISATRRITCGGAGPRATGSAICRISRWRPTREVMPAELKNRSVVDQSKPGRWTLTELR